MPQRILTHELENGLTLVGEPFDYVDSAAFTVRLPAGTSDEPADRLGLAAFVCEMVMRGAGSRDSRTLSQDLENLGVERGDSITELRTTFSGATLSRNLFPALEIYADIIRRPLLPADQIEASRQTAIQEIRAIDDEPASKLMLELRHHHYSDPWGRSAPGNLENVQAITLGDVRSFVHSHFRPNGAILGVAGNFDWDQLRKHVDRLFGDWKKVDCQVPSENGQLYSTGHVYHDSQQMQIGVAFESVPYRSIDFFLAWSVVSVLSGGMSARLFTEVREKRGLCYSIYATHHSLFDHGSVLCYAGTSAERAQETLDVTLGELNRLKDGIRPDELSRLKARIKSSLILQQESSIARSSSIAQDWYFLRRVRTLDELNRIINALSTDDINEYLARSAPSKYCILTLGPEPLEVPLGVS